MLHIYKHGVHSLHTRVRLLMKSERLMRSIVVFPYYYYLAMTMPQFLTGWPQSRRYKIPPSFLGFSRAIIILFQTLLQQKLYVIMTLICSKAESTDAKLHYSLRS